MKFKVKHDAGFSTISLNGDFLSEVEQTDLRDLVREIIGQGKRHLIFDMTGLRHINSCGLGALVCAYTSLRRVGGDLILVTVGQSVSKLLKMTNLTQIFLILPSLDAALAKYRSKKE